MLMEIDIRYPDFEEGYWNDKDYIYLSDCYNKLENEHKKLKDAYDKLEKKLDAIRITNVKLITKCTKLENERDEATERFNRQFIRANYFMSKNSCLEQKYDLLEKEYDKAKRDTSNKDYDILEQKYWEAQRTIDKYAAENEELKKSKKDLTRWMNMYYDLQKERDELENKLLDTEDKLEETERELKGTKRYMEGYQNLYIEEVLKHKESDDRGEEKTLDIYDLEDSDGKDDDNKS